MPRCASTSVTGLAAAGLAWILSAPPAAQAQDPRTAVRFVEGLRERGYFDLAAEYLESLSRSPDLPDDLKPVIAYELGRNLLANAATTGDLDRRKELLDQARGRLDTFTKAFPDHKLAAEGLAQLARLLVERGHLAMIQGDEARSAAEKQAKVAEARLAFGQARTAYDQAIERLEPIFEAFPPFLPEGDPRKAERDQANIALLNARLQRAVVDYEEGQTHDDPEDPRRKELLAAALAAFDDLYKNHREQEAGFYARMWQAKCFEERGDLGPAMGIYNELMTHQVAALRPLQRQVGYFRILVMAKRKEYALAADEAVRWLQANPGQRRTTDGLGVLLELGKNILAQLPEIEREADKQAAIKRATDSLAEVVRVYSPHKAEALELLRKYKPRTALNLNAVANLNYEAAMAEAEDAIASQEWDRAVALLAAAVRRADPTRDPDKANRARYLMAYSHNQAEHFYEASVLAEHLARRYPKDGLAPRAAEVAIKSLLSAYNAITLGDRATDLDRLVSLATYTSQTWPDSEQGDFGRFVVGEVALGRGRYAEAIEAFESIRAGSAGWADAQTRAGAAYWKKSLALRAQDPPAEADAEAAAARAIATLQAALKVRQDGGAPPVDPGLIGNVCDLAEIYLESGKPADALALLAPVARVVVVPGQPPALLPLITRVLSNVLRGHVAAGEVDLALADMKALEEAGGAGPGQAQLYFRLGQLLEAEMAALRKKNDNKGVARIQESYLKFLAALAGSQAGQSYESLQWAGEAMLSIDRPAEAARVFDRVLETYEKDEAFKARPGWGDRLLRTRLKRVAALRGMKDFDRASTEIARLIDDNRRLIEPRVEKALLAEARAEAGKAKWDASILEWRTLAGQLERARPRPVEYYETWYHVAYAYWRQGDSAKARQTLAAVMRLAPAVGTPEMKSRYQDLMRRIETSVKRTGSGAAR